MYFSIKKYNKTEELIKVRDAFPVCTMLIHLWDDC